LLCELCPELTFPPEVRAHAFKMPHELIEFWGRRTAPASVHRPVSTPASSPE